MTQIAFARALEHHRAGRLAEAVGAYRAIVASHPANADAWHLLGIAENQRGAREEAERCLRRALELDPRNPHFHCNLGLVYRASARPDEAIASYRRALELDPNLPDALNNLANAMRDRGQHDEAIALYRRAIEVRPEHASAQYALGSVLRDTRRLSEALAHFRRTLEIDPRHVAACLNVGGALGALNRGEEAAIYFRKAVALGPDAADVWLRAGIGLAQLGEVEDAERFYRRALEIEPRSPAALYNLATALRDQKKLGDAEQAAALCERALELEPRLYTAHYNLGGILKRQGRLDDAIGCYRRALALNPHFADAHINLGYLLMERAIEQAGDARPDLSEARESYERALDANPQHAEVHVNLALLHLLEGDFARGWAEFEWRWQTKHAVRPELNAPVWNGEPLAGRTILLRAEQGFGDTIQFARFAPIVKAHGCTVIGMCPPELRRVLEGSPGVDRWITLRDAVPPFDFHAPLMSLPRLLQTTPETIPASVPYLEADAALVERWRHELNAHPGFRIGIVWRGNPAHRRDAFRSMPLGAFAPLAAVDGVRVFSLQKGAGLDELGSVGFPVVDLGSRLQDFADTAALLMALDLVIGCDTSVMHLAGALARTAWVVLPVVPDWRWSLRRTDTPWYPTMRVYRQRRADDWDEPFVDVAAALARHSGKFAHSRADLR